MKLVIRTVAFLFMAAAWPAWCQWNGTNPVWTNSSVGIGTNSPLGGLHSNLNGGWWSGINMGASIVVDGTRNNAIALLDYTHSNPYAIVDLGTSLGIVAAPSLTDSTSYPTWLMTLMRNGNIGIGTTNPQHLLHVAGTIGAQEVLVTSTGADYVFSPTYRLKPLSEVAAYIDANHHLPDIPSADEVKEKGMGVGEMESKLLAKIEELTLHLIQQDQENRDLRDRLAQLEARVAATASPAR